MDNDIIVTFPVDPPFHINCTHLAEEIIRRLSDNHGVYMELPSGYALDHKNTADVIMIANMIKEILQ